MNDRVLAMQPMPFPSACFGLLFTASG